MRHAWCIALPAAAVVLAFAMSQTCFAQETLWIEAERLDGIEGHCWPMGQPKHRATDGHWGLSGPGWAAEWTQGGESGFLSIACGPDDNRAIATKTIEIPAAGRYRVWVRYRDVREDTEIFHVQLQQPQAPPWTGVYGQRARVGEDNEMKLYWDWAFAWDAREVELTKGSAKLSLMSVSKQSDCRQIDCIVITSDMDYAPLIKDRPRNFTWEVLDKIRQSDTDLEPLARRRPAIETPDAWKPRTFQHRGFLYLWNVDNELKWAGDDPSRVLYPYNIRDDEAIEAFEKKYGGKAHVPIFSDSRIVPVLYGIASRFMQTDSPDQKTRAASKRLVSWLDADPDRLWATLMNYYPDDPLTPAGVENFFKFRDRYVGSIAGEDLGYFYPTPEQQVQAVAGTKTRREVAEAIRRICMEANDAKYRSVFGRDLDRPYEDVIPCPSAGMIQFASLMYDWGARTVGFEPGVATYGVLPMRLAFLRGAARQHGRLTATYRSCNFGDSGTLFSVTNLYASPRSIFENFYSVYSGAGMTWFNFDIWYQYMSGSSMFYHESGWDEYWMPGGTTLAGVRDVQLSPKGKLVDRFLRLTTDAPDRGAPYTPVAFLLDYAHGWEPTAFEAEKWFHQTAITREMARLGGDHETMLHEYMSVAFHPIGPKSQEPLTALNEMFPPGVFGDIFDVIYAYPDVNKWTTIDTYPAVIVAGEIELTAAEGKRLRQYVEDGGTLMIADAHLSGPGVTALDLPPTDKSAEAAGYHWLGDDALLPSQRFGFRPITARRARVLAETDQHQVFCAALDRGKGRLIYLSIPYGLGIDKQSHPVVAQLMAHLASGLMPVQVHGDVEWLLNRTDDGRWLVTLLNPAGQDKPQHGITPTDYRENRDVLIHTRQPVTRAHDRLLPDDPLHLTKDDNSVSVRLVVPAGGVRIIELR